MYKFLPDLCLKCCVSSSLVRSQKPPWTFFQSYNSDKLFYLCQSPEKHCLVKNRQIYTSFHLEFPDDGLKCTECYNHLYIFLLNLFEFSTSKCFHLTQDVTLCFVSRTSVCCDSQELLKTDGLNSAPFNKLTSWSLTFTGGCFST